jgi:hypothetical protein
MTTTLLISENKLKNFSDLNNAIDPDLLKNAIREAQDINIQRMLGYKLYQKILTDVAAGTISGVYKTLLDTYIQDALLYWAYHEALEAIWLRPRNNGLLVPQGGDNAIAADTRLYDKKRESVKNKAEFFSERLVGYIIDNEGLFPEFGTETGMEMWPDQTNQYRSPIVFRRGYREDMKKLGIKVIDSRYDYLPQ